MLQKPRRRGLAAAVVVVAAGALAWTSLASGAGSPAPNRVVVKAVTKGNRMAYVLSSDSVQSGGKLVIKDNGAPHTLSLVTKNLVPRTNKQIANCGNKGHICNQIGKWHKFDPQTGKVKVNPVDVGKPGWDTEGNLHRKGDSVLFTPKLNPASAAPISAAPGTTLHFICAIHPEMHGTLHVK